MTMEVGTDGVAVITIFNPPVNALAIPSKLLSLALPISVHMFGLDADSNFWWFQLSPD